MKRYFAAIFVATALLLQGLMFLPAAQAVSIGASCKSDKECDDRNSVNGAEVCRLGKCQASGVAPESCTGQGEYFDKNTRTCALRMCKLNYMCDDGNWCNGVEICDPSMGQGNFSSAYAKGHWGCHPGEPKCLTGDCDEVSRSCKAPQATTQSGSRCSTPDADGDGHAAIACGGDDCDDSDPNVYPGNVEVCDPEGFDEDCDPTTFGSRDADGDGRIDSRCCNGERCGTDCNDGDANVAGGLPEVCNEKDDNCDGRVDENVQLTVFLDRDKDGFGDPASRVQVCPIGTRLKDYAINDRDCDDNDRSRNPALGTCP